MPYLGNTPSTSFATVVKDTFNGGSTAYTLSKVATTNSVSVFVENVRQEPTTAYSVSGTTLTFTATTPSGTGNIYVLHMNPTTTTTHPAAQNLTAVDGTFTGDVSVADDLTVTDDVAITGKTGMGISSTDVPDGGLHIHTGSAGSVSANSVGDELVIESSGRGGISILTPDANESNILFGSPSDNLGGFITYKQSNTTMELGTSIASGLVKVNVADGTLNTTFEADGDVNISNGNLVVASGHGIDFGLATNDSEMTSELLDDYEEGLATMAFSPGAGSITLASSYEKLSYTKIGRMVHMNGQIAANGISGLGSGNYLQITGLPFAAVNLDDTAGRAAWFVPYDAGGTITQGNEIFAFINEGGSVINIYEQNTAGASNKAEMIGANTSLYFSFTYNTTS